MARYQQFNVGGTVTMRGVDIQQDSLFSTASPEARVPKAPLVPIRTMVDTSLKLLDCDLDALYPSLGRDSVPFEKLDFQFVLMVGLQPDSDT